MINILNKSEKLDSSSEFVVEISLLEKESRFFIKQYEKSKKKKKTPSFEYHQSVSKNYYPKPTPFDIQFEEGHLTSTSAFGADLFYKWNINGISKYEILNILREIIMHTNVLKNSNRSHDTI